MVNVRVLTDRVTQPRFAGVGFHVSFHQHRATPEHTELIWDRWRELRPSFTRVGYLLAQGEAGLEALGDLLVGMQETGTEVYLVPWDPEDVEPGPEMDAFARRLVDGLEHLIRQRGATNVRHYCMTNELSLGGKWARMVEDLPHFRAYHGAIYDELRRRELDVGLLATDASPIHNWTTIEWAAEHMDQITAIYGGHHYFNEHDPADPAFYDWFLENLKWGVRIAGDRGKDFILGEFGCAQDGRVIEGRKTDVCVHFGTNREPLVGMQLAEAVIAALNAGVYAMGSWTFTDYPDSYSRNYVNRWGAFEWEGECRPRAHYYAYGLLTRHFRGPATAFGVESDDSLVRACALRNHATAGWSIAIVNRREQDRELSLRLEGEDLNARFHKYVYSPADVPWGQEDRLPAPISEPDMAEGSLRDKIPAGSLSVYTTV